MQFKPLGKKVLIAEIKRESTTSSGIIIEGKDAGGDSRSGKVLAVGPEVTSVSVDDKVLLEWNKAAVVSIDGAQRVVVLEEHIVAVLEN